MTFPISDIVSLSLTIASGGLRAQALSTPMLIGYHAHYADRVRSYASLTEMTADGFTAGEPLYLMAQALFGQNTSPKTVKIGRKANATVHNVDLTCLTDAVGQVITVTLTSPAGTTHSVSRTCAGGGIPAEATALAVLLNAAGVGGFGAGGTTELAFVAAGNDVQVRAGAGAVAGQIFFYSGLRNLDIGDVSADPGLAADITAIRGEDDDWYACAIDSPGALEQAALALAINSLTKTSWHSTQDSDCRNATAGHLGLVLSAAGYTRAIPVWSPHSMSQYPAVAAMSKMITFKPGATTLAMQELAGVTMAGTNQWDLTTGQLANLRAARMNAYINFGGSGRIDGQAGYCSATRYVDERLTLDYLSLNIPVELANALAARVSGGRKIPYTDEAAAVARAAIRRVLELAESWGAVVLRDKTTGVNHFTFTATPAASQLAADKAARIFAGCEFGCLITGAAQRFELSGTLSFV